MKQGDASRYEILFDLPAGEYNPAEVGGIRTKTIRAGDALEVECFPITRIPDGAKREALRRKSTPAQEKLNRRNAAKRMQRLVDCNYGPEDWVMTYTWDYSRIDKFTMSQRDMDEAWKKLGLPVDADEARAEFVKYLRRVKYHVRKRCESDDLKYIYVQEATHLPRPMDPTAMPAHYHFHAVIHAPGMSAEELKALWPWGDVRCDRLSMRADGPARIANYLAQHLVEPKEGQAKVGRWACSKNHTEPTVTVSNRKVSRRRAALVADDVRQYGKEIFESLYPGYQLMGDPEVKYSQFVAGAYIYARLRKIDSGQPWTRAGRRGGLYHVRS